MQDLLQFTLEFIRRDATMSWLEEKRDEWTPLLISRLQFLLDGRSFILFCDNERSWFEEYFITKINSLTNSRPLLPFFKLKGLYPDLKNLTRREEMAYMDDMLSLTFPNGFVYFYIGKGTSAPSAIAKNRDDSYMWLIDEHAQNSFYIDGNDENLDIKLLNLYKIFDASINAVLFSEVEL